MMSFLSLPAFLLMGVLLSCTGQNGRRVTSVDGDSETGKDALSQALISFDTLFHDFGTIIEGEMVVCYFEYENIGDGELLITSVESSCGCTTLDWNKKPLMSGEREKLKVVFDASGRSGSQRKSVAVMSNAKESSVRLSILANVTNNK